MDLLKFCRRLQEVVTVAYVDKGSKPLTVDELRDVLATLFKEDRANVFPMRLMRPEPLWTFVTLAGKHFFAKDELEKMWCGLGNQAKHSVSIAEYRYMKRLLNLMTRPAEQQLVLEQFIAMIKEPKTDDRAAEQRAYAVADYAFKTIYMPSEVEICYLSSAATILGLPLAQGARPNPTGQVPVFCLNEIHSIRGLRITDDNELLAASVLHRMMHDMFVDKLYFYRIDADRLSPEEVRMATWMSVVIREKPQVVQAPFVNFVIEHLATGGVSLDNVRMLDVVEEANFDIVLAIHCHIQTRLVPILGKAFQRAV